MARQIPKAVSEQLPAGKAREAALRILRLPAVKSRVGLSRSSIYLRVSEGTFPPPISLGQRARGWIEAEIEGWLSAQIEKSRKAP